MVVDSRKISLFFEIDGYVNHSLHCEDPNHSLPKAKLVKSISINHGPKVIKLFSCSTQLSMNFSLPINSKMPTIVGILTFMSGKNSLGLSELKNAEFHDIFILMSI